MSTTGSKAQRLLWRIPRRRRIVRSRPKYRHCGSIKSNGNRWSIFTRVTQRSKMSRCYNIAHARWANSASRDSGVARFGEVTRWVCVILA